MEDALAPSLITLSREGDNVLILVVIEDALALIILESGLNISDGS